MEKTERQKRGWPGFAAYLVCGSLALFVVWTELNPKGVACGGVSTACGSSIRNICIGLEMYATEHNGRFPPNLHALVPNYLLSLPKCAGTFNGCRVRTVFGLQSLLASLGEPCTGPAAVPHYETYLDAEGKPQYRVVCKRKHNGQRRYFSEGERFESVWNGQVRAF